MNGILTIVPIGLVVYVVVQSFRFFDSLLGNSLHEKLGDVYVPGFGILLTIVLITLVGWLTTYWFSAQLIGIVESILQRIPFVKTLYKVIRETIESFVGEKKSFSKVALVTMPNNPMKMLGFITTEDVAKLGDELSDHVAIYVPQTFQVAGLTFLVPKEHVQILDITPEEAMRFILSGGVSGS
ncbi:hypothetical protein CIG75_07555 [Tumebacillus algifaecis]|uniref:DUF502 domain-containing protein n=1 Tax=Tumebacillus algifaecis TaxID=1214604 RepID=A0A223D6S6_9BACL|nr:DUF502 domain-containing protein [Tumebacillus algifaecis]ASS77153.1 hypothetical protein CIG75_07555 [Tumebacillus algifaecis]